MILEGFGFVIVTLFVNELEEKSTYESLGKENSSALLRNEIDFFFLCPESFEALVEVEDTSFSEPDSPSD
jgi:hypothetical protein